MNFSDYALGQCTGIGALDRSVNYGDGCFTTMYVEHGSVFMLEQHLLRLTHDAHKLGIKFDIEALKFWLLTACAYLLTDETKACAIKILVSRGAGGRGYEPPLSCTPQVVISFNPTSKLSLSIGEFSAYKYSVQIANMQLSSQPLLAGIKHLNRLEQVLAKQELRTLECDDLLLCNQAGNVIEATAANVFYLKNGIWITPNIIDCGVSGVMRKCIMAFMQYNGIKYTTSVTHVDDMLNAESVFICNAIKFIVPVSKLYTQRKSVNFNVSPCFQMFSNIYEWLSREKVVISGSII